MVVRTRWVKVVGSDRPFQIQQSPVSGHDLLVLIAAGESRREQIVNGAPFDVLKRAGNVGEGQMYEAVAAEQHVRTR